MAFSFTMGLTSAGKGLSMVGTEGDAVDEIDSIDVVYDGEGLVDGLAEKIGCFEINVE